MRLLLVIVVSVAGCSHATVRGQTPSEWLSTSNVTGCIQKQCSSSGDDADRASCESACRRTYGH